MTETEVLEQAQDTAIALEEKYGSKAEAEKLRAKKTEIKVDDKPVVTDDKKPETIVEKPAEVKADIKGDDKKEIVIEDAFFNPLADTKTDKKEEKPAEQKPVEVLEYEKIKPEYDQFKSFLADPFVQTTFEAWKSGKRPIDTMMEVRPMDYAKLLIPNKLGEYADETIAREYYSKIENLKDAELDEAVEDFKAEEETPAKKRERRNLTRLLDEYQTKGLSKYVGSVVDAKESTKENVVKFTQDVGDFYSEVKKQKQLFGMQLADDELAKDQEDTTNFFKHIFNADGSVNVKKAASAVFFWNHGAKKLQDVAKKAKSEGKIEVLETLHQPDPHDTSINSRKPAVTDDPVQKALDEKYGK